MLRMILDRNNSARAIHFRPLTAFGNSDSGQLEQVHYHSAIAQQTAHWPLRLKSLGVSITPNEKKTCSLY